MCKQLDPDQAQHFVGPDLGPNCLQRFVFLDSLRPKKQFLGYVGQVFLG